MPPRAASMPPLAGRLLLLAMAATSAVASATSAGCASWYDSTEHGSAFRSVKDFGAVGDGMTDDTRAIQVRGAVSDTRRREHRASGEPRLAVRAKSAGSS